MKIDKNFKIRKVEFSKGISLNKEKLNDLINKSNPNILKRIPMKDILAFQLYKKNILEKFYCKPAFRDYFQFQILVNKMKSASSFTIINEKWNEFYIKLNEFWIAGMELLDYNLYMIISDKIDIDHLKFQMMQLFEIFSEKL